MMDWLLKAFVRSLLWLRYRVRVMGGSAIASGGKSKIIFLPNHPALIDPIMLLAHLWQFEPRALADEDQVDRFFIRFLAKRAGVVPIPSMSKAGLDADTSAEEIELGIAKLVECLARGENVRPIKFRRQDFWHDVATEFNGVLARIEALESQRTAQEDDPDAVSTPVHEPIAP